MLILTAIAACSSVGVDDPDAPLPASVPVDLALSVATAGGTTRMEGSVVQQNGSPFRGLKDDMRLVPVLADGTVLPPLGQRIGTNGTFRFNEEADLAIGTRAFYVYARAKFDENADGYSAFANGSIEPAYNDNAPTATTFSLAPIHTGALSDDAAAKRIAEYMTRIATAGGWNTTENTDYKALFENFVNKAEAVYAPLAGSSTNILTYVNVWYDNVKSKVTDEDLRTAILNAIKATEYVDFDEDNEDGKKVTALKDAAGQTLTFPDNLPDGTAALLWSDGDENSAPGFAYTEADNSMSDYTYPAELYYYTHSRIYTSGQSHKDTYTSEASWADVLDAYEHKGEDQLGADVDVDTRSVALIEPLRYGVACLSVALQADADRDGEVLYIRDGNEEYNNSRVTLTDGAFPLTAIMVSAQPLKADYQFDPVPPATKDEQQYIIYDTTIPSGISLGSHIGKDVAGSENYSAAVYTLALQTRENEPVNVVLEFLNNSGQAFLNASQAVIYPGTKFYLVASVIAPSVTTYDRQVFTKGYLTELKFTIKSLAQAYNALPNLNSNNLRVFTAQQAGIRQWTEGDTKDHSVYNW